MVFVTKVETVHTGGGCMVDLIHHESGKIIGVNDECAVAYDSVDQFWDDDDLDWNKRTIYLTSLDREED